MNIKKIALYGTLTVLCTLTTCYTPLKATENETTSTEEIKNLNEENIHDFFAKKGPEAIKLFFKERSSKEDIEKLLTTPKGKINATPIHCMFGFNKNPKAIEAFFKNCPKNLLKELLIQKDTNKQTPIHDMFGFNKNPKAIEAFFKNCPKNLTEELLRQKNNDGETPIGYMFELNKSPETIKAFFNNCPQSLKSEAFKVFFTTLSEEDLKNILPEFELNNPETIKAFFKNCPPSLKQEVKACIKKQDTKEQEQLWPLFRYHFFYKPFINTGLNCILSMCISTAIKYLQKKPLLSKKSILSTLGTTIATGITTYKYYPKLYTQSTAQHIAKFAGVALSTNLATQAIKRTWPKISRAYHAYFAKRKNHSLKR